MKIFLISLVAKAVSIISRLFAFGAGVTWAGEIALRLDDSIIKKMIGGIKNGIIIVAGTNGKTTTCSMISQILTKNGNRVIHNITGANLRNGIAAVFVLNSNFLGKIDADYAIFEVDEASLPVAVSELKPKVITLLNLFRDQLDRYGEVDTIALKWKEALNKQVRQESRELNKTILVANADDPLIAYVASQSNFPTKYFGLNDKSKDVQKLSHATDSIYCLNCGKKLRYKSVYLSHFGDWSCVCGNSRAKLDLSHIKSPLLGVYNTYNSLAAVLTTSVLGINIKSAEDLLKDFKPAFGRQESFEKDGKKIQIFLSKNPAGFNESIRTVLDDKNLKTVMLILNDRIPDGRDVSWIWDVDFENLVEKSETIICSGDRSYDMGLRIKYQLTDPSARFAKASARRAGEAGNRQQRTDNKLKIIENLEEALESGLNNVRQGETLYILPTYSAMLEVRMILTGRKIL